MERFQLDKLMESLRRNGSKLFSGVKSFSSSIDKDRFDQYRKYIERFVADTYEQGQSGFQTLRDMLQSGAWKEYAGELIQLFRTGEVKNFVRENRPVAVAGVCFLSVSIIGIYCFMNIDQALFSPKKVDFAKESAAVHQASITNQPTLENIQNIDSARRIGMDGFGIYANNRLVGFARTKADAQLVLDTLRKQFTPDGAKEVHFQEQVDIRPTVQDIAHFEGYKPAADVIQDLCRGTSERREHIVQQGENLWLIAHKYQIPMDTLISANPGMNPDRVKINQKISLIVPTPMITVASTRIAKYGEDIPYDVSYEDSSSLFKGESKVKQIGSEGQRTITAEIIQINGKEVTRKILNEKVSQNPVKKIIAKGTKNPPPRIGSGSLGRPTYGGIITSVFGSRWGRFHEGLDIGLPIGTPVQAADGGTILSAGWKNGYGLCVIISHGGGIQTLYGHLSQINIRAGMSVFKGQNIARSGNTGNSTGPHLHFGVYKNGRAVNPLGYVRY